MQCQRQIQPPSIIRSLSNSMFCGKSYIGQTGRSIHDRLKEHITNTNHKRLSKSTIVDHSFKSNHLICFDQTKILAHTSHYPTHLIREALEIENNPNNFNYDDDYTLSDSWELLIHHLN